MSPKPTPPSLRLPSDVWTEANRRRVPVLVADGVVVLLVVGVLLVVVGCVVVVLGVCFCVACVFVFVVGVVPLAAIVVVVVVLAGDVDLALVR